MARPKPSPNNEGKRVSVWLPPKYVKIWKQIDNKSGFVQIALADAAGIMAWDILRKRSPDQYYQVDKLEDVIDDYNTRHPVDSLTEKRLEKRAWKQQLKTDSPKKQELW